jgi:hypothetical protein
MYILNIVMNSLRVQKLDLSSIVRNHLDKLVSNKN